MWSRLICVAAISFGLVPQTEAGEQSGLVHRASCTVVRYYVAKYTASAVETWARGATGPPRLRSKLPGIVSRLSLPKPRRPLSGRRSEFGVAL
jgi:hypothetical protein